MVESRNNSENSEKSDSEHQEEEQASFASQKQEPRRPRFRKQNFPEDFPIPTQKQKALTRAKQLKEIIQQHEAEKNKETKRE